MLCTSLVGGSDKLWKSSLSFEIVMSWEVDALSVASLIDVERKLMTWMM